MLSEIDERNGTVKTDWPSIRERVAKVEPIFTKIVDKLEPDKSFPLFLVYYPYGAIEADTISSLLPSMSGEYYRLSDNNIPEDIAIHLGYGKDSSPLGMVLENQLESFIDLKDEGITIPWLVYKPGMIFPFSRILSRKSERIYAPNGLLSSTAGARSIFMLPNIGCATHHANLQRDFNIYSPPPKSLYEHWEVFKELVNSPALNSDWRCCVLYFSEKWIKKLHEDKEWTDLKQYLHELAWSQNEYERNRIYYDITFSMIKKKRNLKPNPYLADTARHLFATALGSAPGFSPATDNEAVPLELIQNAYVQSYGLKKYIPTIMHPFHFKFEESYFPVYYSLQNPSTHIFSPKSRQISTTLSEMRELEHIMRIYMEELSKENALCSDTIIGKIAQKITLRYYHNKTDRHQVISSSNHIIELDKRFTKNENRITNDNASFASDAPFVRGCISIGTN